MIEFDPWKYCKVDPDSVRDNPYVNPPAAPAVNPSPAQPADGDNHNASIISTGDFLVLEGIVCYGSDGRPFESHDRIAVAKDVERKQDGGHRSFRSYDAILHLESQGNGLVVPSYALQCNILVALFQKRADPEVDKVLMQYEDYGPGYGWHNNNTIVDGKGGKIIHYPLKSDFPSHGGTHDINNAQQRIIKPFPATMNRGNSSLEDALKDAAKARYTKDLTGLKEPRILIDIAKHFGKPAWSYLPDNSRTCSAWLGCGSIQFDVDSNCSLSGSNAVRGVREP